MTHTHISAKHSPFDLKLKSVWQYRYLIILFTKRNFTVSFKQTILGPLWLFINPFLTSVVYVVLFGNIAGLSTDGIPKLLFYLSGNALWGYFSNCLSGNAYIFTSNAPLFGKVYFPRLTVPITNALSSLIRFGIQFIMVAALLVFYTVTGAVHPNLLLFPALIFILVETGIFGMGFGLIISALTSKYRDLSVLVGFGLQLWMYGTPVVYPLSSVSGALRTVIMLNPVTPVFELYRYTVLGVGEISVPGLVYSAILTIAVAFFGILIFNKVERTFIDTV